LKKKNIIFYNKNNNEINNKNYEETSSSSFQTNSKYECDYIIKLTDIKSEYYPIYKNSINGYALYGDIHKYLINRKDNFHKPMYPKYYNNIKGRKLFRNLCLNYELNSYNELCFKKLKNKRFRKNKNNIINRHKKKDIEDYILLKIPFKFDYYEKLIQIHKDNFHCSYIKVIQLFNNEGYTYKGVYEDSKTIINICPVCVQKERQIYKREPSKQLIFNRPKERFIGDIRNFQKKLSKIPTLNINST